MTCSRTSRQIRTPLLALWLTKFELHTHIVLVSDRTTSRQQFRAIGSIGNSGCQVQDVEGQESNTYLSFVVNHFAIYHVH